MNPQELLPYIAAALQWARAQKRFADGWFLLITAGAAMLFYCIGHPTDAFAHPWNEILTGWWAQVVVITSTVQLVSSGANMVNSVRAKMSDSPDRVPGFLPVTNSKEDA